MTLIDSETSGGHGVAVVVGQGYVGLPLAVAAAEAGWRVVGIDNDASRIARLHVCDSYVEDVSSARLRDVLGSNRYRPSNSYADAANFDVAVIAVPTPLRAGCPDLSHIEQAAKALAPHLRPGSTVVLESTTYPGTTGALLRPLLEQRSGLRAGEDFHLGYSPERLDPGNREWTFENTPKIVSGVNKASLDAVRAFYDTVVDITVPAASCAEAELAKLIENTFRHVNIAMINELAMFAHELGIDIWSSVELASTKPFGFMRFAPGPGVGGHCLPIDPSYLSWHVKQSTGRASRFVELANDVNEHMPDYVVRRAADMLNQRRMSVRDSRILLIGLAYKRNTGDSRHAPSARVARLLVNLGAEVRAADPHVAYEDVPPDVEHVPLTRAEVDAADLVVVLVDHDAFDLGTLDGALDRVLDTRGGLDAREVTRL